MLNLYTPVLVVMKECTRARVPGQLLPVVLPRACKAHKSHKYLQHSTQLLDMEQVCLFNQVFFL